MPNPWQTYLELLPESDFQEETSCPGCQGMDSKMIRRLGPTRLKYCVQCALHFISPRLTPTVQEALYRLNPSPMSPERSMLLENLIAGRLRDMRKEMFAWPQDRFPKAKVMDIGCGFGHFLAQSKPLFGSVEGVELSPIQAQYAREHFNIPIFEVDLFQSEWAYPLDLISAWELIEHLPNSNLLFHWAFKNLSPGGQLVLSTPNYNSLFRFLLGRHWFYFIPSQHLTHFSAQGIKNQLLKAGFSRVQTFTSGRSLLTEWKNQHNPSSQGVSIKNQWMENLRVREQIEVERETRPAPSQGPWWQKFLDALVWRLTYWPVHHGFGDQLRIYAQKD